MANKITISGGLTWSDGSDSITVKVSNPITQVGDAAFWNIQSISSAEAEAIALGDVVDIGYIAFENKDTTNYIEIGNDVDIATATIRLRPGEGIVVPTRLSTWYAKANTADINLLVMAVEL